MKRSSHSKRGKLDFWAGGDSAYEAGLQEHYETRLASLRDQLKSATTDLDRATIKDEIKKTKAEYKQKRREIGRMIF